MVTNAAISPKELNKVHLWHITNFSLISDITSKETLETVICQKIINITEWVDILV